MSDYVAAYTDGLGFDKRFDTIADDNMQNSFAAAKFNGHVATIVSIEDPLQIALKSLSFHSVLMLVPLRHDINHQSHGNILTEIAELIDAGKIPPIIDESDYSLSDVAKAHDHLSSSKTVGKVSLTS